MSDRTDRDELIRMLQRAYSGEKAAALAYQGHSRAVGNPDESSAIRSIEMDEWMHRTRIGEMLIELSSAPLIRREIVPSLIGHAASAACRFSGWFMPMYIAGRLETGNVVEYDRAALHAERLGLVHLASELRAMARTEHEHELFFKS